MSEVKTKDIEVEVRLGKGEVLLQNDGEERQVRLDQHLSNAETDSSPQIVEGNEHSSPPYSNMEPHSDGNEHLSPPFSIMEPDSEDALVSNQETENAEVQVSDPEPKIGLRTNDIVEVGGQEIRQGEREVSLQNDEEDHKVKLDQESINVQIASQSVNDYDNFSPPPPTKVPDSEDEVKARRDSEVDEQGIRFRKKEGLSQKDQQDEKVKLVKVKSVLTQKTKGQNTSHVYFFLIVVLAVGIIATLTFQKSYEPSHNYNTVDTFKDLLKTMKGDFKSQHGVYWNLLKNSGTKHLKRIHDDDQMDLTPQSYLIAGYTGNEDTLRCFVKRLSEVFARSNVSRISSEKFSDTDDKAVLYQDLASKVEGASKIVVVENIEKLKFGVAQLFMSFSDEHNEVARYPQSLLFLTTVLPFGASQNRIADEHRTAGYFTEEVWGSTKVDLTAPLWSRVGNGLILVKKEHGLEC